MRWKFDNKALSALTLLRCSVRVERGNLWQLQRTLSRGDYIDGYLQVPGGPQARLGIVCSPVYIEPSDGRLYYSNY